MYATKKANCTMSYRPEVVSVIVHALNFLSSFKYAEKFSIVFIFFFLKEKNRNKCKKNLFEKKQKNFYKIEKESLNSALHENSMCFRLKNFSIVDVSKKFFFH
jgi:hypothetical protein